MKSDPQLVLLVVVPFEPMPKVGLRIEKFDLHF